MRLSQLLFIGLLLFALPACDGAAGADGQTGPAGLDGIDGGDGVDGETGADGVSSKSSLYLVEENAVLSGRWPPLLIAECNDANDVLLTGGCSHTLENGQMDRSWPVFSTDPAENARWECAVGNPDLTDTQMLFARAVCIDVP